MEEYIYNKELYKIIDAVSIQGLDFIIVKNSSNIISYMKLTHLESKTVFTPLDKLIEVLKAFNTEKIYNIKKILDYFVNSLNKLVKKNQIKQYDIKIITKDFNKFIKDNYSVIYNQITNKELKKIDIFLNTYKHKSFISKLCNIYGLILLISIIGVGIFTKNLLSWYNEGKSTETIVKDLIVDTQIEEKEAFDKEEIIEILDDTKEEENDVDKYSYDYWTYSKMTIMSVDFSKLKEENSDTVGWIYVNNTNINYPIVQSGDNSYYLNHSFKKTYSDSGWIFADFRSNLNNLEKNTVLYGHGRIDYTMFGSLDETLKQNWYTNPENQIIKLSTPTKNMLWQVISVYTIPSESYYLTHTFENDESYQKFLNTIVGRSIYNFNVSVVPSDNILTLSTCLDNNGNRVVLHAKLVKTEDR